MLFAFDTNILTEILLGNISFVQRAYVILHRFYEN
jgi:hypothetical protein